MLEIITNIWELRHQGGIQEPFESGHLQYMVKAIRFPGLNQCNNESNVL